MQYLPVNRVYLEFLRVHLRKEPPYLSGGVEIAGSIASAVILNVF